MEQPNIALQLQTLPQEAGVYQFFNKTNAIIYVGKAKNLKKRVSSYFQKEHESAKTRLLVSKIVRIEHIVVESENDALLLENNLIKKYQPRYNILLKDGKSYPWICIKNEPFPRIFFTRKMIKDGSQYFGPYTNLKMVRTLLELIKELYPLRSCSLDLTPKAIENNKYKVCLEYHIKNCKAPCIGEETTKQYNDNILQIKEILRGNLKEVISGFKQQMMELAQMQRYEEAHLVKSKLESLESYQAKSTIVSATIGNVEVFSIVSDQQYAYINYLQVAYGAIIRAHTIEIKKKLDENDRDILELTIVNIREQFSSTTKEIIAPFPLTLSPELKLTVPKAGEKLQLLQLSQRNAQLYKVESVKKEKITDPETHQQRILQNLQKTLQLPMLPTHIECFDNSNIQGSDPVAGCVVFKNGKPSKEDYRKFKIKSVKGPDDYASLREVLLRRYGAVKEQADSLPNLLLIDGGVGQMHTAQEVLQELQISIPVVGLQKNTQHRTSEIILGNTMQVADISPKSEEFLLLTRIQDEVHRFALSYHRQLRSKNAISTQLQAIEGIGEKTQTALLEHFGSVRRIKQAALHDIEKVVGKAKAKLLFEYFSQENE